MLTHLVIIFTVQCLCSWLYTALQMFWPHVLSSELLDSLLWNLTPDWPMSFILSSSFAGSCGHSSLCGLSTKIDKERSSEDSEAASKMPQMILPATHNTHAHPYIYIYIYTWMLIIMPYITETWKWITCLIPWYHHRP